MEFVTSFIETNSLSEKERYYPIGKGICLHTDIQNRHIERGVLSSISHSRKDCGAATMTIDEVLYHSEMELREKLLGKNLNVDVNARKEMWAIFILNDEYEIYSGMEAVENLKRSKGYQEILKMLWK